MLVALFLGTAHVHLLPRSAQLRNDESEHSDCGDVGLATALSEVAGSASEIVKHRSLRQRMSSYVSGLIVQCPRSTKQRRSSREMPILCRRMGAVIGSIDALA
ncbi:hypothetical protein ACVWWG_000225 [Bradyrhizobium sp. LB7.2]